MPKSFGICYSRISSLKRYGRKCHLVFIISYSYFSLISNKISLLIFTLSHTFTTSPSPLSQTLLFFPFPFYSLLFPFMSQPNFLSTISQIPSSLTYKISFTIFFFPAFSLSPLCSISYNEAT